MGKEYRGKKLNIKIESLSNINEPSNFGSSYESKYSFLYCINTDDISFLSVKYLIWTETQAVGEDSKAADSMIKGK